MPVKYKSRFEIGLLLVATVCLILCPLSLYAKENAQGKPVKKVSQKELYSKLTTAVEQKNAQQVQELLDQGANPEYVAADGNSSTLLMQASSDGSLEIVKMLVSDKAIINPKGTFHGRTPLTTAASKGYLDMALLHKSFWVVADAAAVVFLECEPQEYPTLQRLAKAEKASIALQEEAQVPHPQLA